MTEQGLSQWLSFRRETEYMAYLGRNYKPSKLEGGQK